MSESFKIYLNDISECVEKIERYKGNRVKGEFLKDSMAVDAVIRNLEIIGEAVKRLPSEVRKKHNKIEWKKIAGLRDVLIHEYSGIDKDILWEVISIKIPILKDSLKEIKSELK